MRMRSLAITTVVVTVGVSVGAIAAGLDSGDDRVALSPTADMPPDEALTYTLGHLRDRRQSIDSLTIARTISDLLPSQEFSVDDAPAEPLGAGIVTGTVTSVAEGAGYVVEGRDAVAGKVSEFNDPQALWRVVEVTVQPEDVFSEDLGRAEPVTFGLAIDGAIDANAVMSGLQGRRVLVGLQATSFFQHDKTLLGVADNGAMLGLISANDQISLPVLEPAVEADFLDGVDTIRELSVEARVDKPVVEVTTEGGVPVIE